MSLPNEVNLHHLGSTGYNINQSLRFRNSASAYLNRTPATATDRKKFTWSAWVKRGSLTTGSDQVLFRAVDGGTNFNMVFSTSDRILVESGATNLFNSSPVYRDVSAWYHIILVFDSDNGTADNRCIVYVNGVSQVKLNGSVSSGLQLAVNRAEPHYIGASPGDRFFDGYMTEINFIDGQALTPSSFGETDSQTGVWKPKKYSGTYGTNGFYLNFSDNSAVTAAAIGKDSSGNGNNWTPNNISLTAGVTYDWMRDSPTVGALASNYSVLNPLQRYDSSSAAGVYSSGNLIFAPGGNPTHAFGTMAIAPGNTDGFYWEGVCTSMDTSRTYIGILSPDDGPASVGASYAFNTKGVLARTGDYYQTQTNGTNDGIYTSYTTNDVVMVAYKNGKLWFGKNGTWMNSGNPAADTGAISTTLSTSKEWFPYFGYNSTWSTNFGQRPFTYTPPSGFKSLNTFNLPTPTVGATSATQANKYFDATTYTGNGAVRSITNSGSMQPDFVWSKLRSGGNSHRLFDSVRGVEKAIYSNLTNAETTETGTLTAFNSNGFSLGTNNETNTNTSTYVAWQWRAGGAAVTNTAGSISAQVSANPSAGFSIVTYTGTGSSATVGHGLGVAPRMITFKRRNSTDSWPVYHAGLGAAASVILNNSNAQNASGGTYYWDGNAPTSSVFSVAYDSAINASGSTYVAYCWSQIAGFSKFGTYIGNGSSDGAFVHIGFRPRYFLTKPSSAGEWTVWDSSRDAFNVADRRLVASDSVSEYNNGNGLIDFLSNGLKCRVNHPSNNESGTTYIYMAFAESPFKYSLAR